MTPERDDVLNQVKTLREKAEAAGLVESDPWTALDDVWKGPEADVERIAIVGEETITAVREAYAEGRAEQELLMEALDLAKSLLPLALRALVAG